MVGVPLAAFQAHPDHRLNLSTPTTHAQVLYLDKLQPGPSHVLNCAAIHVCPHKPYDQWIDQIHQAVACYKRRLACFWSDRVQAIWRVVKRASRRYKSLLFSVTLVTEGLL